MSSYWYWALCPLGYWAPYNIMGPIDIAFYFLEWASYKHYGPHWLLLLICLSGHHHDIMGPIDYCLVFFWVGFIELWALLFGFGFGYCYCYWILDLLLACWSLTLIFSSKILLSILALGWNSFIWYRNMLMYY